MLLILLRLDSIASGMMVAGGMEGLSWHEQLFFARREIGAGCELREQRGRMLRPGGAVLAVQM